MEANLMTKAAPAQKRSWFTDFTPRFLPASLGTMLALLLGGGVVHAGCPNDYHRLDDRAEQATDAFNRADASSRCVTARGLVKVEQMLLGFVEQHQVQCVLDPEFVEVQQRRLRKAEAARNQACSR